MEKKADLLWKRIETAMRFVIYKLLRIKLKADAWEVVVQFVKFGLVGLTNSGISYIVYFVFVELGIHYIVANIIGFTVSVFNSNFP